MPTFPRAFLYINMLNPLICNSYITTLSSNMASSSSFAVILVFLVVFPGCSSAQLKTNFYSKTCPNVFDTVKSVVKSAVMKERRMGASLLRLHFHDCFVNVTLLVSIYMASTDFLFISSFVPATALIFLTYSTTYLFRHFLCFKVYSI